MIGFIKVLIVVIFTAVMTGMWLAFKWGGMPFLAGAVMVMAVYELGYRATFGHWLDWKSGPRHQNLRNHP